MSYLIRWVTSRGVGDWPSGEVVSSSSSSSSSSTSSGSVATSASSTSSSGRPSTVPTWTDVDVGWRTAAGDERKSEATTLSALMLLLFVVNEEEEDDDDEEEDDDEDEEEEDVVNSGLLRLWLASDDPLGLIGAPSNILVDDAFIVVSSSLWIISSEKDKTICYFLKKTENCNARVEMNFKSGSCSKHGNGRVQSDLATTLIVPFSRESGDTRHLRLFSSARNSLRKRAIQLPDPTHTHWYIYLSSLYKIPGLMLCLSCVFIGTVPMYITYSIRPDSLTFFRPTSLYSFDSIRHHPFLLTLPLPSAFVSFDLADDGWIILPKKDPSYPQKKVEIQIKIGKEFPVISSCAESFSFFFDMAKHTHGKEEKYINIRDQENVYAIIINPGRI